MALTTQLENDAVVNESVDDRACGHCIGKDFGPVRKREVGGDADAAALVAARYHLE